MPESRKASIRRKTRETEVVMRLKLDGSGQAEVATGLPFLDHLLTALAMHARLDLVLKATGDLEVDEHHTVEDVAIVLGEGLKSALAARTGIQRYGNATVPLDESRALAAVDCGGRPYAVIELPLLGPRIGTMPVSLLPHFLETLALKSGMTLHVTAQGRDEHHVAEAAFKAVGRALRQAIALDPSLKGRVASTKGRL
jgi:imidazoleglycerol-phosphate dehydratase